MTDGGVSEGLVWRAACRVARGLRIVLRRGGS
jgi:hypothetical protein